MNSYSLASVTALMALGALGFGSLNQMQSNGSGPDQKNVEAIRMIATINDSEVEIGMLATKNGSAFGKTYGQRMVNDHTEALNEIETIAQAKGISISKSMDSGHRAVWSRLSRLTGASFDRAYCKEMMMGHKMVYDKFDRWSNESTDAEVKAYAQKYLPVIRKHEVLAREWWNTSWNIE